MIRWEAALEERDRQRLLDQVEVETEFVPDDDGDEQMDADFTTEKYKYYFESLHFLQINGRSSYE